jgi:photosystem II stability/assembly factor-like uncharacterized protein
MAKRVIVLVGTTKGAFSYHSDERRSDWRMTGPYMAGWEVYSLLGDSRHGNRIFAGTSSYVYGPAIRVSEDFGESWTQVAGSPAYSEASGFKLKRIWQIVPGHPSEPDTLYAGVEEAGLFVSRDRGETWTELSALTSHPTRPGWFPGNGGLCLHTILVDPHNAKRLWVGISAVGAFRTDDGGETWKVCNEGVPRIPVGENYPEIGRCVHKMVLDPDAPNTLYMQYHGAVLKSTNGADSWEPIEKGLPSNFGFPLAVTKRGDLFLVPQRDDESRFLPEGRLRVFRSRDRGDTWQLAGDGLPEQPEFGGVLRDAMAADPLEPAGIYFGTTVGEVFYSRDCGDQWAQLPGRLPRITTVKTWVVAD